MFASISQAESKPFTFLNAQSDRWWSLVPLRGCFAKVTVTFLPANELRACRRQRRAKQGTHREALKPTLPTARTASAVGSS
jgi:hypothetical protein